MTLSGTPGGGNDGRIETLLPRHLADLRASGLSDDQIRACGFFSATDPATVAKLLGWKTPATRLGPCLCIPFPGPDGGTVVDWQVPLDAS